MENVSGELNSLLKKRVDFKDVQIDKSINKCEFCGDEDEKAIAGDIDKVTGKARRGLMWLYPDERWICQSCLSKKSRVY